MRPLHLVLSLAALAICSFACQSPTPTPETPPETPASDSLAQVEEVDTIPAFDPLDEVIGLHEKWTGDIDGMIERQRVRALVPYSQLNYYIDGAERHGLCYEAMNIFERELNKRLGRKMGPDYVRVVFIPLTRDQLIPALKDGYGDIIPANLTITYKREQEVAFSLPTVEGVREVFVAGPSGPKLESLQDLSGKTVHVRKSSSHYEHIRNLNKEFRRKNKDLISIEFVEEHFEAGEILEMVSAGLLPLTAVDESGALFWSQLLPNLTIYQNMPLNEGGELAWAMRKDSPQLKAMLDGFIKENKKGTLIGNILFNKYLEKTDYVQNALSEQDLKRLLATRDHFMKYGEQYGIDWLLLAAQGYQESGLDQTQRSRAGAVGVMQVLPSTARDKNVNIPDIYSLENNIHAGTKYNRFIIDNYFSDGGVDSLNAVLFAMASYNAGPNRIRRLRKEAEEHGMDPNLWFDNVEILAAREIGREPVQYVSNIYKYYTSYRSLLRYMQQTGEVPFEGW